MKLKDLFQSTKTVKSSSLDDIASELESQEYVQSYGKDKVRFLPNVDYSDPANFAFFGSAEKYYTDSFLRIRNNFPYDGSEKEKYDYLNESTFIDLYIFEHRYPRFNGFVNMGYPTWGTLSGSIIDGYGKSNTNTFIKTLGGPNSSSLSGLGKQFDDANKLDSAKSRQSNLKFKLEDGVSIEMWLKKPAFDTAKTEKEVLFDLWNGEASSSAQYGRLRLELTGASSGSPFLITALSGASGSQNFSLGQNLTTGSITDWTHVAVTLKNSGSHIQSNFYINGALNQRQTLTSASIGEVTGSIISYIGALRTAPSGSPTVQEGAGKFSGSLDEFRYWKAERTSKQIGRYYWTNIGGGTNTDDANTSLGVYYKFNEGITQTASYDSTVLDYSGRVSNGTWTGYQSGARSTGSAIVLSNTAPKEYKDPTIYSVHPEYISVLTELERSGNYHDVVNDAALFKSLPSWITDEDNEKNGNLKNLTQAMASYFDNTYLMIKELNSLKDVYSHFQSNITEKQEFEGVHTTSLTGAVKPLPFADRLLTNAAFVAPELFADATIIEALADRTEDEQYEMKLHNIKNQIYQNVYSGLMETYKQKGTKRAFRNILHAYGVDEDIVKINMYGDNVDFEIADRYNIRARKEKFVDFNHPDRFAGTVYQYASGTNGVSFISGSGGNFEKFIPVTFETQVILPNKLPPEEPSGYNTNHTKSVIAGAHEADGTDGTDYTIPGGDNVNIQLYSERDERESKRVKFHLSSSALGVHLSSSLYDDQYLNNEWLFAFRLTNDKRPTVDLVSSSSISSSYILDFVGYNTEASTTLHSFHLSSSVSASAAHSFLNSSKRFYVGAKRENFTGSLQEYTDHKIGFARFWMNNLSNDVLLRHAHDSTNYGAESPFRSAYLMEDGINDIKIPEIDTLILNWDFESLSSTDSSGEFIALDVSSGSGEQRYVQAFESIKRKFYHGKGANFLASDNKVIDVEYINSARSTNPEVLNADDMIEIRTDDDIKFTRNTLPQDYYIAFEKSMAQTISEEMINFMSSITAFNDLIGRPVDRYRMEYKDLTKLRQLFFERVSNELDLDKYIDYYKWLDDALGEMLVALVPASLKHSDGINNVIENHLFSRDKYFNKFPTIEFKTPTLEGGMNTINRHLYPWKTGHAPVGGTPENENCFWWLERAERDRPILSGSASGSNNTRVKVFQARNSVLNRSYTTPHHFAVDRSRNLHGGTNYEDNKKRDYIWSATKEVSETPISYGKFGAFPLRYVITNNDMFQALKDCNDETPVTTKLKRAFGAIDGYSVFHNYYTGSLHDGVFKGGMVMPFNIMSSSVATGYAADLNGSGAIGNIDLANVHSDTVDNTNAIPMQGPFTERWVGGHQHRHSPLNTGNDTEATRPEGYKILLDSVLNESGSIGVVGADYPYPYSNFATAPHFRIDQAKARYYREERAKRPLNIKNIQTTGSTVGNYQKNYQFVHTFGRTQQKLWMREEAPTTNRHNATNTTLPATTQEASLIARGTGSAGNLASNFNSSSLYLADVKTSTAPTVNTSKETVFASRFSAPGGFETLSQVYLDIYGREKSSYNALPFRNLSVRGSGSGESGTIRIYDIHGNRYGLITHLTRHAAQFGIDSVLGGTSPAFHKINRNPKWDPSEGAKDYDNYWVQHQIPQSDFQYKWVKQSHTASYATSSLQGHVLSGFTEPSGTVSVYPHERINNVVVSQSVLDQRITGTTAYGFPSWEQIRNNDRNLNAQLRKAYGYNIDRVTTLDVSAPSGSAVSNLTTVEESRVTENVPNTIDVMYQGSEFQFKYPFVNMKYHFDNVVLKREAELADNETLYESLQGFYSQEGNDKLFIRSKNIKQILFPQYIKHTKYNVRHRHFYVSHFWNDGENDVYRTNLSETGSYFRLDEGGRREQSVTASLWAQGNLNSQAQKDIALGTATNIIPSQSIWSMDSRTNFTSSSPIAAASNSAGAPGVLQNQDHHFHNGVSTVSLVTSGTAATGTFQMAGATRFGTFSSGSFSVQGMQPTGIAASGSFEVTSSDLQGTPATGEFTVEPVYSDPVSASYQFTATTRTILSTPSTGSFEVSGAGYAGTAATSTFNVQQIPVGGERSYATFDVHYELAQDGDSLTIPYGANTPVFEVDTTARTTGIGISPVIFQKALRVSGSGKQISGSFAGPGNTGYNTTNGVMIADFIFKFPAGATASLSSSVNAGSRKYFYSAYDSGSGDSQFQIFFNADNTPPGVNWNDFSVQLATTGTSSPTEGVMATRFINLTSEAAWKDTDWNHITVFVDYNQASAANKIKVYLNGTNFQGTINTGGSVTAGGTESPLELGLGGNTIQYLVSDRTSETKWGGEGIWISEFTFYGEKTFHSNFPTEVSTPSQLDYVSYSYVSGGLLQPVYLSGTYLTHHYKFGDGFSSSAQQYPDRGTVDGGLIYNVDTSTGDSDTAVRADTYLTVSGNLSASYLEYPHIANGYVHSKFANSRSATEYFDHVSSTLNTHLGTYYDIDYVQYTTGSTGTYSTYWYNTSGSGFVSYITSSTSYNSQISTGEDISFATFMIRSKAENAGANYQLGALTASNGGSAQRRSFITGTFSSASSIQTNAITGTIEDTGITIDGNLIAIDHHSNSVGGTQVATYTSVFPCLQGVSTSNQMKLANNSYHTSSTIQNGNDISVSFWNAYASPNSTAFTILQLDSLTGNSTFGAIWVYQNGTAVAMRIYDTNGTQWQALSYLNSNFNYTDLNHFVYTFDASNIGSSASMNLYLNGENVTSGGTFSKTVTPPSSSAHVYNKLLIGNVDGSTIYEHRGRLSQIAIWDKVLTSAEAIEVYHDGRVKDLHGHSAVNNLVHWYKLGTEAEFTGATIGATLSASSIATITDNTPRSGYHVHNLTVYEDDLWTISGDGIPSDTISDATFRANLTASISSAVSGFTATQSAGSFTLTADSIGTASNGVVSTEDSPIINSLTSPTAGGTDASGSANGDRLTFDGGAAIFIADTLGTADSSPNFYVSITGTDDQFWNALSQSIKDNTNFGTINISGAGSTRTFSLTASSNGSANNITLTETGDSFNVIQAPTGGIDESGAGDGDYVNIRPTAQSADNRLFIVDRDGDGVDTSTSIFVDSTQSTDVEWWNALSSAIGSQGFGVSYVNNTTSSLFTVITYITGAAGNAGPNLVNGVSTFNHYGGAYFTGGTDTAGAQDGDTLTISGTVFTITHAATSSATEVQASGVTNDAFWSSLRTKIEANTSYTVTTGSDNPRTFTITSSATGSAQNPSIAETGSTFTIVDSGTAGTDTTGAEDGDSITIDGTTFSIDLAAGLGTGSTTQFHNALSKSIKDNTDFDTIAITDLGNGYHRFSLTSSVTGTAKNVAFTQNTNGSRATFQNLAGASGGTSPIGIQDLDYIKFRDEENTRDRYFAVDLNGDEVNDTPTDYIYIDASGYTGSDADKSTQFWNDLSAAIIANTAYDTVSYTTSSNTASFSVTSSITGSIYNNDILQVYTASDDGADGFTIVSNTAGGTDESGASAGDSIVIGGTTFQIVHSASPTATQINASGVTDTAFFNAMTAAVIANEDYDLITYTTSSNTASFSLTSSTGVTDPYTGESFATGTAFNSTTTLSPVSQRTFSSATGIAGGTNGTFVTFKFKEVIPQPRYMYPHVLTSPGSLRAPTAKSNLGLIDQDYKLRSNHFSLTRSLGHATDGLYDNTSRWTTPDLSGLTPFDNDYNAYYERIRGNNKHYSLIPEFRMSTHVKSIIQSGSNALDYFQNNYWLELTGTSLDGGSTVATNKNATLDEFNQEYAVTSKIKNMEGFIADNVAASDMIAFELTLTCDAIKSFLPYEGFYPQTRTVQMCEAFAESYAKNITSQEADPDDTTLEFPDNNVIAQSRPVFDAIMSPGLLYNTIKSGMAVDYPVISSKMATASLKDPYGGTNYMISNENFESRLPFETLLEPEAHMSNLYMVDLNPHPSSSFNLKSKIGDASSPHYRLMANNFFAESMAFFLEGGSTSKIISKPDSDPDFGIVIARHDGTLPVFKSIFKVFKSKKAHPYVEFKSAQQIITDSSDPSGAFDKYHYRPSSGSNHFLREYVSLTGSELEYELDKVSYPRPQMNPYAEVETITMYSQPNAFGPPCAGGVAAEFDSISGSTQQGSGNNNTTYMMYDSTNGYNAPYTPPYYDGEAWAIYTFTPQRAGKHTLDEIIENTTIEFLRYELNHDSGSYGDRGTFGPQGFTINENAMQVDASFNLFKQATTVQRTQSPAAAEPGLPTLQSTLTSGKAWVIESKYETPILDFSKYLNRAYNAVFESDTTTSDVYTGSLSLSGTRAETDTLSSVHASLGAVHELSGILNPIGMWHQYGSHPAEPEKGIFMQIMDVPQSYTKLGTRMTIANPKYVAVVPTIASCDGTGLDTAYNTDTRQTLSPYFKRQKNLRRLVGSSEFSVEGGAIQVLDADTNVIIDSELRYEELQSIFGSTLNNTSSATTGFKYFDVFRDTGSYTIADLTSSNFTTDTLSVVINGTASSDYTNATSGNYPGHWAASYYNIDRAPTYAPLLIITKNLEALSYDYGEFSRGFFEDFLKDFSIGINYYDQSSRFEDADMIKCAAGSNRTVFVPAAVADFIDVNNNSLTIGSLSQIGLNQGGVQSIIGTAPIAAAASTFSTPESALINSSIQAAQTSRTTFKATTLRTPKYFGLIPPNPAVSALASADTSSYNYSEPQFVRGSIRFNAGSASATNDIDMRKSARFTKTIQYAPQSDNNIAANPSTVRWGQYMHQDGHTSLTQSLASLVGFQQEPVKMGVTATERIVSEAIVAIPYIHRDSSTNEYLTLDSYSVNKYLFQNGMISVDRTLEGTVRTTSAITPEIIEEREGAITLDPNIVNQIELMKKYVLPPHIDFLNNNVQPVPMYIFEFQQRLDRDDLTSIWQGVATAKMKKVEFMKKSITHNLSLDSFMQSIKQESPDMSLLKDVRWRVFKVKQRANHDYRTKMAKDLTSRGLTTTQPTVLGAETKLGYNWPYDYFSLIENAKITVDINLRNVTPPDLPDTASEYQPPEPTLSLLDTPAVLTTEADTAPASFESPPGSDFPEVPPAHGTPITPTTGIILGTPPAGDAPPIIREDILDDRPSQLQGDGGGNTGNSGTGQDGVDDDFGSGGSGGSGLY